MTARWERVPSVCHDCAVLDLDALAQGAQDGDADALERFVRAIQPDVWRFCVHLTRFDVADDLAQESLVRVIEFLPRWNRGPALTWALGVARNVCREHIRRVTRRRTDPVAEPTTAATPDHGDVVPVMLVLASLPIDQREAIVLTQLIGLPYASAASVIGCPIGTVRSRVARGRETLAIALNPQSDCQSG